MDGARLNHRKRMIDILISHQVYTVKWGDGYKVTFTCTKDGIVKAETMPTTSSRMTEFRTWDELNTGEMIGINSMDNRS